jgi:hypothetical protein
VRVSRALGDTERTAMYSAFPGTITHRRFRRTAGLPCCGCGTRAGRRRPRQGADQRRAVAAGGQSQAAC